MTTLSLEDAQARLPEILQQLQPGEEITITDQGMPLAQVKKTERTSWPCQPGSAKDQILWIAPDFDAPLEDFKPTGDWWLSMQNTRTSMDKAGCPIMDEEQLQTHLAWLREGDRFDEAVN